MQNQTTEPVVTTATEPIVVEPKVETKSFTQEEVDAMIQTRLSKVTKGLPTKEELEELKQYKESKKTEEEKQAEVMSKLSATESEKISLKQENIVLKKGVSIEEMEFVQFKVSKMDGDFEENLTQFLLDNPKYTAKETAKPVTTGFKQTTVTPQSEKEAILESKYKNNPYYKG